MSVSPISDVEFDVLTTLQNKLEGLEIYDAYLEDCEEADDDEARRLFEQIRADDTRHVERLRDTLARLLAGSRLSSP